MYSTSGNNSNRAYLPLLVKEKLILISFKVSKFNFLSSNLLNFLISSAKWKVSRWLGQALAHNLHRKASSDLNLAFPQKNTLFPQALKEFSRRHQILFPHPELNSVKKTKKISKNLKVFDWIFEKIWCKVVRFTFQITRVTRVFVEICKFAKLHSKCLPN